MISRLSPVTKFLSRFRQATTDLLFPPRCLSCDGEIDGEPNGKTNGEPDRETNADQQGRSLCDDCQSQLRLINWPTCPRCVARIPTTSGKSLPCSHCRGARLRFDRALALGLYEGRLRELILRMKTDGNDLLARALGDTAWQRLCQQLSGLQIDVVASIPMHPWRRWQRGANPQRAVAELIAGRLQVPTASGMLRLRRKVPTQLGLSRVGRFRNLHRQMRVAKGYHLRDAHVLVVDDILTTGATCSEAARALKQAGARQVAVLTLARTENAF